MIIKLPFQNKGFPITQLFGERFLYRAEIVSHKGVDWAMPKLTPLLAPFSGEVCRVEKTRDYGYGRTIYIRTNDKELGVVEAILAHCEEISLDKGMSVQQGQIIAYSGNSGFWVGKTGYHLHFGLKINGIYVNPLDYIETLNPGEQKLFPEQNDPAICRAGLGEYVIKEGDTLWKIAEIFYGHGGHYIEIFNANQGILSSPNKLKVGDRIKIPYIVEKGL